MGRSGPPNDQAATINGSSLALDGCHARQQDEARWAECVAPWPPCFGASLQVLLPFLGYYDLVALPLGCAIV
jgi:hypothetical protein